MEKGNFVKRLFSPIFSSGFSKGSRTVPVPPSEPPADSLEARQLDLKQPESAAEGGVSDPGEGDGDGKREGEAREVKHDSGADGEEVEGEKGNEDTSKIEKEGDGTRGVGWKSEFPVRPEAQDCAFYLKTGTCKFGSTCKFNHPIQRKPREEMVNDTEESKEKTGQVECKYYLTPGGCKYGKACRYNHSKDNSMVSDVELNFLGLPIRPGEKECPFYMRTGTCKFSANCKFNHPDPTSRADSPPKNSDDGFAAPQNASDFPVWSSSRALHIELPSCVPIMYPPMTVVSPPNAVWNGYQFPLNPQSQVRNMHPPPAYIMNSPTTAKSTNQQQQMWIEEFPERPGQPDCSYFLRTGDCKCDHSVQLTESGLVKQPSIQRRAPCENHDPFDGQVKDCIRSHCDSAAASNESSD